MIKNATVLVTNKCNSHCLMCNIWKWGIVKDEMTLAEYEQLFSKPEFAEIEDLNISGGEALLRKDIIEIILAMTKNMPKLHMFFLSTNGTNPHKAMKLFSLLAKKIKDIYLCISLEGNKRTNKQVRGIDSHDLALETIRLCRKTVPQLYSIISMTLTKYNCNLESLEYIRKIANKTGSTFSFRMAWLNDTYYHNLGNNIGISEDQKKLAIDYIQKYCLDDPFMRTQIEFFNKGKVKMMDKCLAGDVFILVRPDGTIYPCINSSRRIGDKEKGIYIKEIIDLGKYEQCPCCTECCFYPMLNWSKYSDRK